MTTRTATVGSRMSSALTDIAIITRRNVLRVVRLPQLVVFSTFQPVMFLLLFNYVFGGSIARTPQIAQYGDYINWLIPGIMLQTVTFGASQTAVGLTEDLGAGVIDRFRSLPMARSAVLAGRTISDLLRNLFVLSLLIVAGAFMGFRYQTSLLETGFAVLLAAAFAFAFSWVMASIGLAVKDTETAQLAGFLPLFPLVFASSVFVPLDTLPDWLRVFADYQPVTVLANACRGLILGEGALPADATLGGTITLSIAYIVAILAVFVPLSVWLYRRAAE